jgi:hypothetical protein
MSISNPLGKRYQERAIAFPSSLPSLDRVWLMDPVLKQALSPIDQSLGCN